MMYGISDSDMCFLTHGFDSPNSPSCVVNATSTDSMAAVRRYLVELWNLASIAASIMPPANVHLRGNKSMHLAAWIAQFLSKYVKSQIPLTTL